MSSTRLTPTNLDEKMLADFQEGTAPDVLQGCCDFLPAGRRRATCWTCAPLWKPTSIARRSTTGIRPSTGRCSPASGAQFALPKYHGALALYYNKDLFDRYGVPYPDGGWTHDDYTRAMLSFVKEPPRRR